MSRRWTGVDYAWAVTGGLVTFVAGGIALLLGATDAEAQNICDQRDVIVSQLEGRYGEDRVALGVNTTGHLMEVWGNEETGSWSITTTTPQGITCLNDAGQMFQRVDSVAPAGEPS